MAKGAERVSLTPHWTPTGAASIERACSLVGLRL